MRLTSFPSVRKISVLSLALTCALGAVASDGYERLTYLQGTGNGEAGGTWINTGYVPTCTDRIEFRMQFLDIQTAQGFYCSRMSGTDRVIACILSASKREYLRFDRNNDNSTGYSTLWLNNSTIYDVVADYNTLSCTMNGEQVARMASGDFTPVGPLTLFALYSGASPVSMSNYAQSRLYSCRIYDKNGTLVREFLPAHDKSAADDSIARYGLFETVTGTFLPNCGALAFGVKTTDLDRTFDVADIVTQNVSRAPCRPSVTVVDPKTGAALTEGEDYEVDYANNLAVGTAYVCVSGKAGTAYEGVSVYKHFMIGESALPEGYTKLAYIATTRKTGEAPAGQWVDTGYVPTCEDRFEIKVRTFDEKLAEGLFCSRLSATEATMAAVYPTASPKKLRFDCNTDNASGISSVERTAQEDTVIVADYKTRQCTIDGVPAATMASGSFITAGPVALLGLYVGLSPYDDGTKLGNPAHARLYYFKVFDRNGKLVREYIPARDDAAEEGSRTQYGLYETVTATFHPNRGPVAFAAGDVVATSPSRTRFAVADIPPQVLKNPVACEPVVEVTDESTGAALVCGRDYEVRYADNDRAGTGRAVVSGKAGTDYEGLSFVKPFVVSYRRLGGRYQRVTFLRTDGNQFTDTGYTPSCTDRVEFRFKPGKLFVQGYYCSREDTTKNTFALVQPSADTTRLRFDRNTDNKNALSAGQIAAGRIYTVEADGSTLEARINGNPMATMEGGDFTPIGPFMLFSLYYGTSITPQMSSAGTPATCTFYEFRVWDKDGNLVCDCVPARDTEAEEGSLQQCGVYNLITRKFYPNYGKSAFAEYGADEPYVPGPMSGLMLIVR